MKKVLLTFSLCLWMCSYAQNTANCGTVKDYDGNVYNTVVIGRQCWLRENLRTTHYSDGESIPLGSNTSATTAYRYAPGDGRSNEKNSGNVLKYGYLYNWPAVLRENKESEGFKVQGVCPIGWHVPSNDEWIDLINYMKSDPNYTVRNVDDYAKAKALTTTWGWRSSDYSKDAVGNNPSANNSLGFSAPPAGFVTDLPGTDLTLDFLGFGTDAEFWSATKHNDDRGNCYDFSYDSEIFNRGGFPFKYHGLSVRCLSDMKGPFPVGNKENGENFNKWFWDKMYCKNPDGSLDRHKLDDYINFFHFRNIGYAQLAADIISSFDKNGNQKIDFEEYSSKTEELINQQQGRVLGPDTIALWRTKYFKPWFDAFNFDEDPNEYSLYEIASTLYAIDRYSSKDFEWALRGSAMLYVLYYVNEHGKVDEVIENNRKIFQQKDWLINWRN